MADIEQMIDQEGPKDGQEEEQGTPRELSTPTQDEAPNPIEGLIHTLAPGVSASGVQAAASALKDFVPLTTAITDDVTEDLGDKVGGEGVAGGGGGGGGMDEISDEELLENNEEDLGNLAVKPVQENSDRLSNVSSISNSSKDFEPSNHKDSEAASNKKDEQDDEVSLSGLSSPDENELKIRSDVEDGEINDGTAKKKQNQPKDSSDSSDQENNSGRQRRRFRKRSETSENRRSLSKSSDSEMRPISPR